MFRWKVRTLTYRCYTTNCSRELLEWSTNLLHTQQRKKLGCKLTEETMKICKKRNDLAKKSNKSNKQNIELVEIRKLAEQCIRRDIINFRYKVSLEILKESGFTKKMRKALSDSKCLMPKLENDIATEIFDRKDIADIANKFYAELYI